jgi:hypothetical protein
MEEEEAKTIRAQLADADGRVASKFFLVIDAPFSLVCPFSDAYVLLPELEIEMQMLHQVMDIAVVYMCA